MKTGIGGRGAGVGAVSVIALSLAAAPLVAQQQAAPTEAAAVSSGGAAPAPPSGSFWAALGDTTLARLTGQALAGNRDVHSAQARLSGARAASTAAGLQLTPSVTANAGYARQRYAAATFPGAGGALPDQTAVQAGLDVGWDLDVFGRNRKTWQGQRAFAASAREAVRDVQVQVAAEVATAYYDLVGAHDRLATAQRNIENMRRTLALTEERLAAGRGNAFDSERARAQLSSTLAELPLVEAQIEAIQNRLAVLTGVPVAELALGSLERRPVLPEPFAPAALDSVVARRPDVLAAERRAAAQAAMAGAASAEFLPRFQIVGSAGYLSGSTSNLGDRSTERYSLGAAVSWPLNMGRVKANADAARADARDTRAQYELTVLRAREELATALVTYRRMRERLTNLDDAAAASERAAELARLRFQEGATDFLQVLDAQRTLLAAQDRRSVGRTEATSALVAVYRAMGGQ